MLLGKESEREWGKGGGGGGGGGGGMVVEREERESATERGARARHGGGAGKEEVVACCVRPDVTIEEVKRSIFETNDSQTHLKPSLIALCAYSNIIAKPSVGFSRNDSMFVASSVGHGGVSLKVRADKVSRSTYTLTKPRQDSITPGGGRKFANLASMTVEDSKHLLGSMVGQ